VSEQLAYLPDGHGLSELCLALVAEHGARVHLRLTRVDGVTAIGACGKGLGELWTGKAAEVNCPECLEVVHA
jgi:hypothetical protein